jgi:hypothetical protein
LLLIGLIAPAMADEGSDRKTVGNVAIYLGLLPAEMIRGHRAQHPETSMHGGQPAGSGEYHVVIALFDAGGGARITNAAVSARVSEVGLAGEEKTLQPMEIAGTETYGSYFRMSGNGPFRIALLIHIPGDPAEVKAEFEHRHR